MPEVEVFDTESEIFSEQEVVSQVLINEVPAETEVVVDELEAHHDQVFDTVVTELATPVEVITSVESSQENEAVVDEEDITVVVEQTFLEEAAELLEMADVLLKQWFDQRTNRSILLQLQSRAQFEGWCTHGRLEPYMQLLINWKILLNSLHCITSTRIFMTICSKVQLHG